MNLDEIRAKLAGLANGGGKRKDLWKPKDKHVIRLLPYPHGEEPFIELGFHYDIGKTRSLLCPAFNFGEDCPICEFAEKLRSWNDEDGNEKPKNLREADFEIFKAIQVKPRYYAAMVERTEDGVSEPKFWAFGKMIYETLLKLCIDEEMNEMVDGGGTDVLMSTDNAFDLKIDFMQPSNKDGKGNTKTFPITEVKPTMRTSKLAKNKAAVKEILDAVPNMEEVYPRLSQVEVQKIFDSFISAGVAEVDPKDDDDGKEYAPNSAEKPVEGRSIEEAFDTLSD